MAEYDSRPENLQSDLRDLDLEEKENLFPPDILACISTHSPFLDQAHEDGELPPLPYLYDYSSFPADIQDMRESEARSLPPVSPQLGLAATNGAASSAQCPPGAVDSRAVSTTPNSSDAREGALAPPTSTPVPAPTSRRAPTRSCRKCSRADDIPDLGVAPKRPSKKARTRKVRGATVSLAPVPVAQPVAGPSNVVRARAEDPESEQHGWDSNDDVLDPAEGGTMTERKKRPRRTHREVVRNMLNLPLVACPVCDEHFDPKKHEANRVHLMRHYGAGAIKGSAPLVCLWEECGASVCGKRMITHVHAKHVGLAFVCPYARCSWRGSRAKDLPQHLARDHKGDPP